MADTTLEEKSEKIKLECSFSDGLAYLTINSTTYIRRRETGDIERANPIDLNPQMYQFSHGSFIAEKDKEFDSLEGAISYLNAAESFDDLMTEATYLVARVAKLKEEEVESPYDLLLFEGDMIVRGHKSRLEEAKKSLEENQDYLVVLRQIPNFDKYSKLLSREMNPDEIFEFFKSELGHDI